MHASLEFPTDGRCRAAIARVTPQVDGGRFVVRRTPGERLEVEADIFTDGHDTLSAVVKCRAAHSDVCIESEMRPVKNDRWRGEIVVGQPGSYFYNIVAWVDRFKSWQNAVRKKIQAHQDVSVELAAGAAMILEAAKRADALAAEWLTIRASELTGEQNATGSSLETLVLDPALTQMVARHAERLFVTRCERDFPLVVDSERARFSSWYEMFPRSAAPESGRHGTFQDCLGQLDRIADMGFDVLYFPPIHPIGQSLRKGKNNNPVCQPDEPGSPWAIGASTGGHRSIHPQLGTVEDFRQVVEAARGKGIEVALDIALQCSPDHPYVREHPEWFRRRADRSIQYAENPPKKYQDIYPFDFECDDWRGLWLELKSIFDYWIAQGVRVFRVDNPHTKTFAFWEWCLGSLRREQTDLVFLAEAFTRPAVLYHLAKLGFTQSYNYFPWRNSKEELTTYLDELTHSSVAEFFRPSLWTNTPDILPQYLQSGGRPAFEVRLILAATLAASYGVYGPAFETCENLPIEPGSEEYLASEKYEIRHWNLDPDRGLHQLMKRVNRIRRENPALQFNHSLTFHPVNNDFLLAYSKSTADGADTVLTVVNLDPHRTQTGWLDLPPGDFLPDPGSFYQMHDLLTDARFLWRGTRNFIELNPRYSPAHIFRLRRRLRTERDFDYYM
jgi:starch synthase (maltosyl-transferring)